MPDDERVSVRPMFGAVAGFANGLMFMGLFADELFVRLNDSRHCVRDRGRRRPAGADARQAHARLRHRPRTGAQEHDATRAWGRKALDYTLTLPPKK